MKVSIRYLIRYFINIFNTLAQRLENFMVLIRLRVKSLSLKKGSGIHQATRLIYHTNLSFV